MGIRNLSTASIATGTKRSKFWDQSAALFDSDFQAIATTRVTSATTNIVFDNIPQDFKHLQIRVFGRAVGGDTGVAIRYNNTTGSSGYNWQRMYGDGANNSSDSYSADLTTSGNAANYFAGNIIDILNYADSSKLKSANGITGYRINDSSHNVQLLSCVYSGAALAVTKLTLTTDTMGGTSQFAPYTRASLYGWK
jgi:hypothetical protein